MKFEREIQLHLKGSKRLLLLLLLLSLPILRSDVGIDVVVTSDFQLTLPSRCDATAVYVVLPTHHFRV